MVAVHSIPEDMVRAAVVNPIVMIASTDHGNGKGQSASCRHIRASAGR